uniref:Uncharacterized protein n=1 Tax=Acrobeloides nanus TaxID=290746 RepID=A0A914D470_9BILA
MHSLAWTFAGADVPHRCRLPEDLSDTSYALDDSLLTKYYNISYTPEDLSNTSYALNDSLSTNYYNESYPKCSYEGHSKCPNGFVYDNSEMTYSAIQKVYE